MYIEQSYYASHITRWLQFFPRERILILIEEEIYARPEEQAKRVYNFLDINESHECDYLNKLSSQSQPKSVQMEAMFKKLGSLGRKTGMENWVTAAKNNSLVSAMRQVNTNELKQTVPPMRPETWSFLQEEFIDEIVELADLLGRVSFPWPTWSVKKRAGAVKGESRQVLSS
jgi:hypothetical protein